MDILDEDLLNFWRSLQKNKVRYIMVGGFATRFHGYNRNTDDLDLWLEDTSENRRNLRKAFIDLGYGDYENLETIRFVPGWTSFYVGNGIELDIMTEMKGINASFNECFELSSKAVLEDVTVSFLHINHLIDNKRAINRPKDQDDVINLKKIRDIREERGS